MKNLIFKCFLLSLFTCCCFFGIDKVYANTTLNYDNLMVTNASLGLNGTALSYNRYNTFSSTQLNFNSFGTLFVVPNEEGHYYYPSNVYERTTLCIDKYINPGANGEHSSQTYFMQTSIKCRFPNSSYTGLVTFVHNRVSVSGTAPSMNVYHEYNTQSSGAFSISLLAIQYSLNPFPVYTAEDTLIQQNDEIKNLLTIIKDGQNNLLVSQNKTASELESVNKNIEDTNKTLKDSDTSEASGEAESFFSGFTTDTHGLTSIITAPLTLIGNITSSTCSPLALEVPFLDGQTLNLPCMSSIYRKHFGSFLDIYQIFTFGIVAYWVCVKIFNLVKDFKNPDHDEVEVMDL